MEETGRNFCWLFKEEQLQNTPSVQAGISLEQELMFRQKQAMLIQTIGLKSGLTQLAVNTSVIFMHRFFMYRTVKAFPRVQLAIAFAFAGGKVEESARKLEHLIRTAVEVIRHNRNKEFLDKADPLTYEMDSLCRAKMEALCQNNCSIESGAYLEVKKLVLECETEIYAVIGFQLQIVHPHNYVIRMCTALGENIKDISQYAYNLATASSQLTMLCLKYKPETIATMCLNIASKAHSVRFEPMKDDNVKWYQVIVRDTDFAEIEAVSEEFLQLIKECPLLPSWMSNLARISRANNNRALQRAPVASSSSAPQGGRQGQPALSSSSSSSSALAATTVASIPSSAASTLSQSHPARPAHSVLTPSQGPESQGPARPLGPQSSQGELKISPSKPIAAEGGSISSAAAAMEANVRDSVQQLHSRPLSSGGAAHVRPQPPAVAHHSHHQQHRSHPPGNGQTAAAGRPTSKPPQGPTGMRPLQAQHPGPLPHPSAHHSSRPGHDQMRPQDPQHQQGPETTKVHDPARSRDPSRSEQGRSQDAPRHNHGRADRRADMALDAKRAVSQADPMSNRPHGTRPDQSLTQVPNEISPHTPQTNSPQVTPPGPELSQSVPPTLDATDSNLSSSSPENVPKSQLALDSQKKSAANQGPKLSLMMYRERASAKIRTPVEQNMLGDDTTPGRPSDEMLLKSVITSPSESSLKQTLSSADITNFNRPQDSPSNPRIKIKVKRDPSSGERHVRYPESGLKIKIKPLRSEAGGGSEGEAGPSGVTPLSKSSTPREEGEIVEDTPPSSGDSEQKSSERLKIRLTVPKSEHASAYNNRRESEQGSNGYTGERESGHRSHHHGHHRSHHHSKSKKHWKHERSRHEGRSSSKRSVDHHDERPSKTSRTESFSVSSGGDTGHRHTGYLDFPSSNNSSSRTLQQQNSGFSINDAFSSAMPHNIFDDDDDDHFHSPVTPTADVIPPHHEKFHQLMAQHRAGIEASKRPPLPKGPPPPPMSPPPPPPSPPNL